MDIKIDSTIGSMTALSIQGIQSFVAAYDDDDAAGPSEPRAAGESPRTAAR